MRRIHCISVLSFLVVLLLAASAFADSQATMTFPEQGGDGVPNALVSHTLSNSNGSGAVWQANVTKATAVIFSDTLFHGGKPNRANLPIWALFTAGAKNSPHSNSDALYSAAVALAPALPKSFFSNVIYTPVSAPQCAPNCAVPEPGTLLLFGSGLVVLAETIRKKLARS